MRPRSFLLTVCFAAFLIATLAVARRWQAPSSSLHEVSRPSLGTVVTIKVAQVARQDASAAIESAFAEIGRVDSLMTGYSSGSELAHLQQRAPNSWIPVSEDMLSVLRASLEVSVLSSGAFDITVGALTRLWGFCGGGIPHLPSPTRIAEELCNVGYQRIDVDVQGRRIRLGPGTTLDLGGVAAGYAVDRAIEILREGGVANALIDAGGDIRTIGKRPDGNEWAIAVRHPRDRRDLSIRGVGLSSVATSGDYQHFFIRDGRRYHHILDPANGYPATRSISVTVWAETAIQADILSTAVFVMGPEKGVELIERVGRAEALVFFEGTGPGPGALRWCTSKGLSGRVNLP